ncbi:MAG: DUF4893 domain-containing protein [Celeribacter sp.]
MPRSSPRQPRRLRRLALLASLLSIAFAPQLSADPVPLRDADRTRLARYHDALGQALEQAYARGAAEDLAALSDALRGRPQPPQISDPSGDWQCRTLKIGGMLPLVVYGWFDCRLSLLDASGGINGGPVWKLEKLTGSQRSRGVIESDGDQLIYRGAAYVAGRTPPEYDAFPERIDPEDAGSLAPDVGVLQQVSDTHMRLMLPLPFVESVFNLLEFRRRGD